MTVTLECGQPVVDLFIDRLFLKCSIASEVDQRLADVESVLHERARAKRE